MQSDSTVDKALQVHAVNPILIPVTTYGPQAPTGITLSTESGVSPEHMAPNKQKTKTQVIQVHMKCLD